MSRPIRETPILYGKDARLPSGGAAYQEASESKDARFSL